MKKKLHVKKGDVFNRLTCIKFSHIGPHYRSYFLFKCDCGNKKILLGSAVVSGNTKSCGCFSLEVKQGRRISENHCEITAIILSYKRHAKSRGFIFKLDREFVTSLVSADCHYCGIGPSNFMKTKNSIIGLAFNGIDRIDSNKDYSKQNVVACCRMCNNAKSNHSTEVFIRWIKRVYNKTINGAKQL